MRGHTLVVTELQAKLSAVFFTSNSAFVSLKLKYRNVAMQPYLHTYAQVTHTWRGQLVIFFSCQDKWASHQRRNEPNTPA